MKARYFHLAKTGDSSFVVQHDRMERFYDTFHYHPEVQLTWISEGSGSGIVGDRLIRFEPGTVVFIGAMIPHVFRNDLGDQGVEAVNVYYDPEQVQKGMHVFPELQSVAKVFSLCSQAYEIRGLTRVWLADRMARIVDLQGFERLTAFFDLLNRISRSDDLLPVSAFTVTDGHSDADAERLSRVFGFVLRHFPEPISLDQVSALAHMTPTAFCRYFKSRTRKTFFAFLLDIRVSRAMHLLLDTQKTVTAISTESGFSNMSHFNREFKKRAGCSPVVFRQSSLRDR